MVALPRAVGVLLEDFLDGEVCALQPRRILEHLERLVAPQLRVARRLRLRLLALGLGGRVLELLERGFELGRVQRAAVVVVQLVEERVDGLVARERGLLFGVPPRLLPPLPLPPRLPQFPLKRFVLYGLIDPK